MQTEKIKKIVDTLSSNTVTVFSKTYCPYCDETKEILATYNITPKIFECDIDPLTSE